MDPIKKLNAGCQEILELLDAYALGAVDKAEAAEVERHVADCVPCWEELVKSQRTAALLALSVPIRQAPRYLIGRIIARAERERAAGAPAIAWLMRPSWRTAARLVGFAGVAALVLAGSLQLQMSNLRGDKNELADQLSAASAELEQQRQIVAVLSAEDSQKIAMEPAALRSQAESVYNWSRENASGFVVCHNFPSQAAGRVYQVWFVTDGMVEPVATFVPQDGGCQIPMDMSRIDWRPEGIGISVEPEGGSDSPTRPWLLYASFGEPSPDGSGRSAGGLDLAVAALGP